MPAHPALLRLLCLLCLVAGGFVPRFTTAAEPGFGWTPVPEASAALAARTAPLYGDQVRALMQSADTREALLYRFLANRLHVPRYTAFHQLNAGTCVSASTCQSLATELAIEDLVKRTLTFTVPPSVEAVYAMGRERARALGPDDGSCGAWSCECISDTTWGICLQGKYGPHDLTTYDPQRAQRWAAKGTPAEVRAAARGHFARAITRLSDPDQVKALLQNGYPAITCSRESYRATRDAMGFAPNDQQNSWPHAMAIVGYRGPESGREGWLILNSWGDWCSGPYWPDDQPIGSFWITRSDLREHLAFGDSWAIGDLQGFAPRILPLPDALDFGGPQGPLSLSAVLRPSRLAGRRLCSLTLAPGETHAPLALAP